MFDEQVGSLNGHSVESIDEMADELADWGWLEDEGLLDVCVSRLRWMNFMLTMFLIYLVLRDFGKSRHG